MIIVNWMTLLTLGIGTHVLLTWIWSIHKGNAARSRQIRKADPPGSWQFVSVIVPAWKERGTIEACIDSLMQVDYPLWEVIIVAGGPDGTYQAAVERCKDTGHFHVIEQQPRGKNAALNQGLSAVKGEIIVLLDADSRVFSNWLRELVIPINGKVRATTGNPIPSRQTPVSLGERIERISAWNIHNSVVLQGSGSIALCHEVVEEIGGFPEDVLVGVDWDLDARLSTRGIGRAFCSRAIVHTERPATLQEYWSNEVRWRRAHLNSLFRLPGYFLSSPASVCLNLYIYALSWMSILTTCAISIIVVTGTGSDEMRKVCLTLWIIFVLWILLRRAALAAEVAIYTRNLTWLKLAWVPPLLLCITLGAIVPATLTLKRNTLHFKGPRLHGYGDHAG